LDDLNAQAQAWCLGTAADRRWREDGTLSVRPLRTNHRAAPPIDALARATGLVLA